MIEVMGTIKQGGFNKVALLVEQTDGAPGSTATGTAAPTVRPAAPTVASAPVSLPTTQVPRRR